MYLPPDAAYCIEKLEQAGFPAYAVGGCVRDALLGLTPQDYDICTVATPAETARIFAGHSLVRSGEKHGTIGVVLSNSVYEITTFRTEGSYGDSRHPDWVAFVSDIAQDLARRDFTVNAMAYSTTRGFADPFGGREDLKNKVLRAVGDPGTRFSEDALRILRGVRFAVRYGLTVEKETLDAMFRLAHTMEKLARERVLDELCKLLPLICAEELCAFAPILTQVLPELEGSVGFDQHSPYHAYDVLTHTAHVVEAVPPTLPLKWAALLHDAGKPAVFSVDEDGRGHFLGHAARSAALADTALRRLKAPTGLREQVVLLVEHHMTRIEPTKKCVRRWLSRLGKENLDRLLQLQEADMGSKGTGKPAESAQFDQIRAILAQIEAENACLSIKDLAVNGHVLMALGFTGPAIGRALQFLLDQVLDEQIENEKNALLDVAKQQQGK